MNFAPQAFLWGKTVLQPKMQDFFVGSSRFFAVLLCVTQGKTVMSPTEKAKFAVCVFL